MTFSLLQFLAFLLLGLLLVGYSLTDGFDLGAGVSSLGLRQTAHKRAVMLSVGPVWDGNEVWLIAAGTVMFGAFPQVYATIFSGFYMALMLVLFGLIFRALALEFRGKVESPGWERLWCRTFGISSAVPALLFGVALGNVLRGIALDGNNYFADSFWSLLNPYALLVGVMGLAMLTLHGTLWIILKIEGEPAARAKRWLGPMWGVYVGLFAVLSVLTWVWLPRRMDNFVQQPWLWIFPLATVVAMVAAGWQIWRGQAKRAFVAHGGSMVGVWSIVAASLFPTVVPELTDGARDLTVLNATSTPGTLLFVGVIAAVVMPLVLTYTAWTYRFFGGKIRV